MAGAVCKVEFGPLNLQPFGRHWNRRRTATQKTPTARPDAGGETYTRQRCAHLFAGDVTAEEAPSEQWKSARAWTQPRVLPLPAHDFAPEIRIAIILDNWSTAAVDQKGCQRRGAISGANNVRAG